VKNVSTRRSGNGRHLVISFGCKVSRIEAVGIGHDLERGGSRPGEPGEEVGLVVVHGCSVTDRAERDAFKEIRKLRREHPDARIVVSGCLSQQSGEAVSLLPEVDAIDPAPIAGWGLESPEIAPGRTRAFLKIQDGCERRCSYCILPRIRGAERSAPSRGVVDAILRLGEAGVGEVVLSGVHLAGYLSAGTGLLRLLEAVEGAAPACRIRLSSLEPMETGESLVDFVASSAIIVPHLHLPLQSGSDATLRRMRRGMTRKRFESLAARAVRQNPRLHLATDLIAGFPGETDEEFRETIEFVSALPFASLHVFPFSSRSGTEAEGMHLRFPVPFALRRERAALLRAVGRAKFLDFTLRATGTVADTLRLRTGKCLTDHYIEAALDDRGPSPASGARFLARLEPGLRPGCLRAVPIPGSVLPTLPSC
jgi:threonylcarbamoyladenosine tRNA methylthiotransferase MtaB